MMTVRELPIEFQQQDIVLSVEAPVGVLPLDDYREVCFELPDKGRYRAVFFLLPGTDPSEPQSALSAEDWAAPVRWDDPTMQFVPSLDDASIQRAVLFILNGELEDQALERLA